MALAHRRPAPAEPDAALYRLLSDGALWRAALGACNFPLLILDAASASRTVTYCNPAFEQFFGYRREEVLGRALAALLFRGDEPLVHRLLAESNSRWKLKAWDKEGSPRPVEIAFGAVHNPHRELTHWVVSFADRGEVEKLRSELEALKGLAALP